LFIAYCLIGCARSPAPLIDRSFIDGLADTVYVDQSREALLTDLTGGFYYDDGFRSSARGEYGYSRWERRYLAGWALFDLSGRPLDIDPELCIVHPEWVERHYGSGLSEIVEVPVGRPGLLITVKPRGRRGVSFRPEFDFRRLDREGAPSYLTDWDPESSTLVVARSDTAGGWLAVTGPAGTRLVRGVDRQRITHPKGELTGRVAISLVYLEGDLLVKGGGAVSFAIGWGVNRDSAATVAQQILKDRSHWRAARQERTQKTLEQFALRCEDRGFECAFAWARLMLAAMVVKQDGERFLITGIPYSPYPDGWHTMLSLPGLAASEGDPAVALRLMDGIIARQNRDTLSSQFGMFPGRIGEDEVEYRVPEIAGLAVVAVLRMRDRIAVRDTTREDSLVAALLRDMMGTIRHRLMNGLVFSGADEHFLRDTPAGPDRSGATIETQVLFGRLRAYIHDYPRRELLAPDLPPSLLEYRGRWSSSVIRGPQSVVERMADRLKTQRYVAGAEEVFDLPAPTFAAVAYYHFLSDGPCGDRLPFRWKGDERELALLHPDYTVRIAQTLALGWHRPDDRRFLGQGLERGIQDGLVGQVGLRTLSPFEEEYQPVHLYRLDDAPSGTVSRGDVLLWSAGTLADMLRVTDNRDSLEHLAQALAARVTGAGVVGGLHEAENAEPISGSDNVVGSPVFSTSLAEFIRLVVENIIGFSPGSGSSLRLRPWYPEGWGVVTLEIEFAGGRFQVERLSGELWRVSQTGIESGLRVALDVHPAPGERGQSSLSIYPGQKAEVRFIPSGEGRWKSEVKEL